LLDHPSTDRLAGEALGRARLLDLHIQRSFNESSVLGSRMGLKGDAELRLAQPYLDQPICMPLSTPPAEAVKRADAGIPLTP
jgi:hypothetical protein